MYFVWFGSKAEITTKTNILEVKLFKNIFWSVVAVFFKVFFIPKYIKMIFFYF
jgi:predicted CDP-diglyceride synthetase/phosphatidate cytidylyltransferase